jgi:hypothetical protein
MKPNASIDRFKDDIFGEFFTHSFFDSFEYMVRDDDTCT